MVEPSHKKRNMSENKKLLYGLTTTAKSNWRDKINEIKDLGIKELALLPTMLNSKERQEMYSLLEATPLEAIPYCHLRDDFLEQELEYLMTHYKTKIFSIHADNAGYALHNRLAKYAAMIAVENPPMTKAEIHFDKESFAAHQVIGICLDLAHYQTVKNFDKKSIKKLDEMLASFPIMLNHIGPFHANAMTKLFKKLDVSHYAENLTDFDYLKDLPAKLFGDLIVMELENSFVEQQEIKKYLELILTNKVS